MIIKRVSVTGFLGRKGTLAADFASDLNIVTGYNGAGKTNFLKLLWYTLSGNINLLLEEVSFSELTLETDSYTLTINKIGRNTCRAVVKDSKITREFEDVYDEDDDIAIDARDQLSEFLKDKGSSLFFPTFRRIEGGFTINPSTRPRVSAFTLFNASQPKSDLQEAVLGVSRRLSQEEHTFVTSISTIDIAELLLKRYTEMSEGASTIQSNMSQEVVSQIRTFKRGTSKGGTDGEAFAADAERVLDSIRALIEETDKEREAAMAPLRAVQELAARIFRHKGIQINRRVSFGDAANAVNSDLLSAGEKQMLSFICYNAFTDHSIIFIDEPELSLHVDWQRILFPTLESQLKSNQFIIATHSPFIYSKYPEKEIALTEDRGGEIADNE